ncbi:MAG: hypothetical protein Tsb009_26280 [Planctomycetaceae bacterium]
MRWRVVVLPVAAVVIVVLCVYKLTRSYSPVELPTPDALCEAPHFELPDQKKPSQVVRLKGYVGRHRIILVFFDGEQGAEQDSLLVYLRDNYDSVKAAGIVVLGISTALPQQNRPAERSLPQPNPVRVRQAFPFPLLTDLPPSCRVHRLWGRYDKIREQPTPGVFLIEQNGLVACVGRVPKPLAQPRKTIDEILFQQ